MAEMFSNKYISNLHVPFSVEAQNISQILALGDALVLQVYAKQTLWTLCLLDIFSEKKNQYIFLMFAQFTNTTVFVDLILFVYESLRFSCKKILR